MVIGTTKLTPVYLGLVSFLMIPVTHSFHLILILIPYNSMFCMTNITVIVTIFVLSIIYFCSCAKHIQTNWHSKVETETKRKRKFYTLLVWIDYARKCNRMALCDSRVLLNRNWIERHSAENVKVKELNKKYLRFYGLFATTPDVKVRSFPCVAHSSVAQSSVSVWLGFQVQ